MQAVQAGVGDETFIPACHVIFDVPCNTGDEMMLANIARNVKRDVRVLLATDPNPHHAVLVGGGPSLKRCLPEIKMRQICGQHIIALNGAAQFLRDNGIVPDFCAMVDARAKNVEFLEGDPARYYLLCSQVHPDVFDALEPERVLMFHPAGFGDRLKALLPKGPVTEICGAATAGLFIMATAYAMGYRALHLYGYDSCDEDGEAHAYSQGENDRERVRVRVKVGDQVFSCSHAMAKQAEHFPRWAAMLAEAGAEISVHGDGLIPALTREMTAPFDASLAAYDLGAAPASYDFIAWLVIAEMARRHAGETKPLRVAFIPGPNEGFRSDGLPQFTPDRQQMLDNVLRPALKLVGAVEDESGRAGSVWHNRYTFAPIVDAARRGQAVPVLRAPDEMIERVRGWLAAFGMTAPVTITLRESKHWPHRNSRLMNWLRFAGYLYPNEDVVFVRDTAKAYEAVTPTFPIFPEASENILVRMALYGLAKCNLFVGNGPAALAFFSGRPYLMFSPLDPTGQWVPGTDEWWRRNHGIGEGEQFPWSSPVQRIVWDIDAYSAIRAAWDEIAPQL